MSSKTEACWQPRREGGSERGYRDGPGRKVLFDGARGLALDARVNVLVVECAGRIREIAKEGVVTTVAGTTHGGSTDGPGATATFEESTGFVVAPDGHLFVLEPHGPGVRRSSDGYVGMVRGLPESGP